MRFAMISLRPPTEGHEKLAAEKGVTLVHVGNVDAFTISPFMLIQHSLGPFDGVVVTQPAAALRLSGEFPIGLFKMEWQTRLGGTPWFEPIEFHIYDLRKERK